MSSLYSILWYIPFVPSTMLILIAIYANIRLHKQKNELFIEKRTLPLKLNFSMIFGMCFATLFYLSTILNHIWLTLISQTAFYAAWFLIFSYLNARSWIIYFRYRWTYYTLQLEWQQLINPNIVKEKQQHNWYIHNYKRYGNVSYVHAVFGVLHFISFIITITFSITIHTTQLTKSAIFAIGFIILIFMFLPAICHIIIIYKIPIFHDHYYIHRECKLHSKLSIVLMISYAIANISQIFIFNKLISGLILILTIPYILFLMIYVSTFIIMSKNKNKKESDNIFNKQRVRAHSWQIALDEVLSDSKSLHLLMVHLSKEFSIEVLLSYIEINQFQAFCLNEINSVQIIIHNSEKDKKDVIIDTQPKVETMTDLKNVPTSQIVHETCSSLKFDLKNLNKQILADTKMKAHELYNKFIAECSRFEINISDIMRSKLTDVLEDKDNLMNNSNVKLADFVKLFEEPKKEMKMLLQYSYERFKNTEEYQEIVKMHKPQSVVTDMEILDRIEDIL